MLATVDFGNEYPGIATVGYKVLDSDGDEVVARTTAGVVDYGGGKYGATVTLDLGFVGVIYWDTVEDGPVNAIESIDLAIPVNVIQIDSNATAASNQRAAALGVYEGEVTGAATLTTLIDSGLVQADVNIWNGLIIKFLTGPAAPAGAEITGFDPGLNKLTFTAVTAIPASGNKYVIG